MSDRPDDWMLRLDVVNARGCDVMTDLGLHSSVRSYDLGRALDEIRTLRAELAAMREERDALRRSCDPAWHDTMLAVIRERDAARAEVARLQGECERLRDIARRAIAAADRETP